MANQINSIGLTGLKLALHNDFHNQVHNLITGATPEALHIEKQDALYLELIRKENSIVKRQTSYVSTAQLKEMDKKRDNALGVIMSVVNAHRTNTIGSKRDAALYLNAVLAPYRGIGAHEYRVETREIAGMLAVLAQETNMAHLQTLGLTEEYDALDMANAQFEAAMSEKQQEEAARMGQTSTDTLELRAGIDGVYAEIVQIVNAYAVIQSTEVIEKFINDVNAVITLVKRSSAAGTATDEEEPETEPDETGSEE